MKKRLVLALIILAVFMLAACDDYTFYDGRHPELFVIASHSLLGVSGGLWEDIMILDEDAFGRILFAYSGFTITNDSRSSFNILAVLVAQRTTETHSYFYGGDNFILAEISLNRSQVRSVRDFLDEPFVMQHFTVEQIEELKTENSWNEELNEDRFFQVQISRRNKEQYLTHVTQETQQEAYRAVVSFAEHSRFRPRRGVPLTMDRDGNVIFFMRERSYDSSTQIMSFYPAFLFMFDSGGELIADTGTMELTDLWNYRDQLREFKEANEWNFYYR